MAQDTEVSDQVPHRERLGARPATRRPRSPEYAGGYFSDTPTTQTTSDLTNNICQYFKAIKPTTTAHHDKAAPYVPRELATADWIFLRHDAVRRPFQRPYDGPFKVMERTPKTITIDQRGKRTKVGIDRCKPAFLNDDLAITTNPQHAPTTIAQQPRNPVTFTWGNGISANNETLAPTTPPTNERARQPPARRRRHGPVPRAPTTTRSGRTSRPPPFSYH